jgi:hypothetical protein
LSLNNLHLYFIEDAEDEEGAKSKDENEEETGEY